MHSIEKLKLNSLVVGLKQFSQIVSYVAKNISNPMRKELIERELKLSEIGTHFFADTDEERIHLYLRSSNTAEINLLRAEVAQICPNKECYLTGEYVAFADYSTQLIKTLFESLFLSLFLVTLILFYLNSALQSQALLPILISTFWSPFVMLCLIFAFQLNINMVTCIVASLLVGLTGDNAIQYLFAGKKQISRGILKRGSGSIQCTVIMVAASLVLLKSPFEPPRHLGWLLSLGFILALVGDLWILKGLLNFKFPVIDSTNRTKQKPEKNHI